MISLWGMPAEGYWSGQIPQQAGPHVTNGAQRGATYGDHTWITESTESLRKLGK